MASRARPRSSSSPNGARCTPRRCWRWRASTGRRAPQAACPNATTLTRSPPRPRTASSPPPACLQARPRRSRRGWRRAGARGRRTPRVTSPSGRPPPNPPVEHLARDHLADERTYLAWLRTAINMIILGIAIAKLVHGKGGRAEVAGLVLVAIGLLLLGYGTRRTRRLTAELEAGRFTTDTTGPLLIAGVVVAGLIAAALLLLV